MANAFKILSALLSYPEADLIAAGGELHAALAADPLTGPREKAWIGALVDDLSLADLYDAQERYVLLFDRTRSLSLHLFEHVHGESRDRGQAMVDLMATYEEAGFLVEASELPDYLPLFLEYLSTRESAEARELLGQTAHILSALRQKLQKRDSIYANAFLALEAIAGGAADPLALQAIMAQPEDDPEDLSALDRLWEEEAVTFLANSGEGPCGTDRLRTRMRAEQRSVLDPAFRGDH